MDHKQLLCNMQCVTNQATQKACLLYKIQYSRRFSCNILLLFFKYFYANNIGDKRKFHKCNCNIKLYNSIL